MISIDDLQNNVDKIDYFSPQKIDGRTLSIAKYRDESIIIECPFMRVHESVKTSGDKIYMILELDNSAKIFYELLSKLEKRILSVVYTNSVMWFGREIPFNVIDDFYNRFVRVIDGSPMIRICISKEQRDNMMVKNDDYVKLQIRYTGLLFYKQTFIDEWLLVKIIPNDPIVDNGIELITDTSNEYNLLIPDDEDEYEYEYDDEPAPVVTASAIVAPVATTPAIEASVATAPVATAPVAIAPAIVEVASAVAVTAPAIVASAVTIKPKKTPNKKKLIYGSTKHRVNRIIK
jgi:hypothetical protein